MPVNYKNPEEPSETQKRENRGGDGKQTRRAERTRAVCP